jgi:nucleoside-diphosphate-sugar epimerase
MKIFLIGGTGFLGSYLVPRLIEKGHHLTLLTRNKSKVPLYDPYRVSLIEGDLLCPDEFVQSLSSHDLLVNIARPPFKPGRISQNAFNRLREQACQYIRNSFLLAERLGCPIIQTSGTSFHTVGDEIADESWPIIRKGIAAIGDDYDAIVKDVREKGIPPLIEMLPAQIYGPGGLFLQSISMLKKGKSIQFGDGSNRIPKIHVEDCAEAYVCVIEKMPIGERFIISDDYGCTSREFSEYAGSLYGAVKTVSVPLWIIRLVAGKYIYDTLQMDCRVSNQKAKTRLGWTLKYPTFREGLLATVYALKTRNIQ